MKNYFIKNSMHGVLLWALIAVSGFVSAADKEATAATGQTSAVVLNQTLDVYKKETCSCCAAWMDHLKANGFKTVAHVTDDMDAIKKKYAIAAQYQSCHTAVSKDGYVFEGHIPARVISQFLSKPPKEAIGLAVPGMPAGSPGMEMGDTVTPYDVLLLKKDGTSEVYEHITKAE